MVTGGLGFAAGGVFGTKVTQLASKYTGGKVSKGGFMEQIKGAAKGFMQNRRAKARVADAAVSQYEAGGAPVTATGSAPVAIAKTSSGGLLDDLLSMIGLG